MPTPLRSLFLAAVLGIFPATALSQLPAPMDSDLVYVPVTVTESSGRYVTGLRQDRFELREDNVRQDIVFFSEEGPVSVGLLVDAAGAARDQVRSAAAAALSKASDPADQILMAETRDLPLNEAVYETLNQLLQVGRHSRRALVLFTSRSDPGTESFQKVKELLRDQDVRFYVVSFPERQERAVANNESILTELSRLTGGQSYFPRSLVQVEGTYSNIALQLRNQYLIGYRPSNTAGDGKWRKIKVTAEAVNTITRKTIKLTARTREGYYAPTLARPITTTTR